jgi:cytochrome c
MRLTWVLFFSVLSFSTQISTSKAGPLQDAARDGDLAGIAAALDAGADIEETVSAGTALALATQRGHLDAVTLLLDRGADINAMSTRGPALTVAVARGNLEMTELLLARGADVNLLTPAGKSALHLSLVYGFDDIAAILRPLGVVSPEPEPVTALLASADAAAGEAYVSAECWACHSTEKDGPIHNGPLLWGVVGRDVASEEGVEYSPALSAVEGDWSYEALNTYLAAPMLAVPGVAMELPGIPDVQDRANVIAYLRTLSDEPVPLP